MTDTPEWLNASRPKRRIVTLETALAEREWNEIDRTLQKGIRPMLLAIWREHGCSLEARFMAQPNQFGDIVWAQQWQVAKHDEQRACALMHGPAAP